MNEFPFPHIVIDNFLDENTAEKISADFPHHDDSNFWTVEYNTPLEIKKACSYWDRFPPSIYSLLFFLNSEKFVSTLRKIVNIETLIPDYTLHGGGLHSHAREGKLNIHKDYSIHPKITKYMRRINLILYLTPNWNSEWGGGLEFWTHDEATNQPKERAILVENVFNRAVIFDTTKNSWHGLPKPISCPKNVFRKSLACYYLSPVTEKAENLKRALYAPYGDQKYDQNIIDLCEKRSKL